MRSENETGQREGIKSSINDLLRSWPEMLMSEEEGNQNQITRVLTYSSLLIQTAGS